jgi:4-amino-4-deoxy-L-arabinose transferase-like glycosyltransferase
VLVGVGLFVAGCWVDWERLPIDGLNQTLNDQVGYISVARHWLDDGRLDSSVIYPSLLGQKFGRNSLYMPGFYAELALTFRMLGYSALTARLPALVSFLLACGLVYWIARRLFDREAAIYALALFAFFPLNLFYAFTAMAEMPLVAAGLAAFSAFLAAPEKFRWWVGPVALALPMLFRETGVALGVVMCAMLFFSATEACRPKATLCGLLVCVVLVALVLSPAGAGRPSMWKANILAQGGFEALYSNAFALKQVPDSGRDWVAAVGYKFHSNLYSLMRGFAYGRLESAAMLFLLSGIPLGVWLWLRKRDAFALGVALAVGLLLIADLGVYTVWSFRGIRSLLLMEPFVAVLWGMTIGLWTRDRGPAVRNLLVSSCFVVGLGVTASICRTQRDAVAQAKEDTSFLESVIGDSKQLVVSPWVLSLDYVNEHYPQRWAFVPANCPTLQLLDLKEGIGTLIVPAQPGLEAERGSCGTGLKFDGEKVWRGTRYWVFRREKTR